MAKTVKKKKKRVPYTSPDSNLFTPGMDVCKYPGCKTEVQRRYFTRCEKHRRMRKLTDEDRRLLELS